jgi:hypothetical protein
VRNCEVFVAVCSETYGHAERSRWTLREFEMADARNRQIVPIWHSGAYPPDGVEIYLGGKQRVPSGVNSDVRKLKMADVVRELMVAFAKLPVPCLPAHGEAAAKRLKTA